ncbi:hypothetical protein SEA_FEDE_51 [Microbacterium phage Fede]|nr:hypothetical protein SEA_FEDE_51 [Microbacterium phage Fede]
MNAAAPKAPTAADKALAKAEEEAKKIVGSAHDKADSIIKEADEKAKAIVAEAKSDADNKPETPDSSINDKFNELWAQIEREYEEDDERAAVLAGLTAVQFAAKGLDD